MELIVVNQFVVFLQRIYLSGVQQMHVSKIYSFFTFICLGFVFTLDL